MASNNRTPSRRTLLTGAGLGLGSGLLAADHKLISSEYWVKKGSVPLYIFRKRMEAPKAGQAVLFLVHGSSISSRPSFDLTVPGRGEYSLMNTFAQFGFDVWTMDHENYGRSGRTDGNSDIASGLEDLKAAVDLVTKETGQQKVHFFRESSGALRA